MSDYAQDLLGDFESLIGSGQDDLDRMMEMAGRARHTSQLNEGVMDSLVSWAKTKVQELSSKASPKEKKAIIDMVTQASGGTKPTLNLSTIKNVAAQLKPVAADVKEKMQQMQGQQSAQTPAVAEGLKDMFNKYGGMASLAGGAAAGYAADKVGDMATAVGKAAEDAVPIVDAAGQFLGYAAVSVARLGAANRASFNLDMASYALAALCVVLVVYSWLHSQNAPGRTDEEDDLSRMMEMAGIKKKAVDEEKTEEGNLFTKGLADDDVKIGDKIPGTNAVKKKDIDESIFDMTRNLWKSYNK
jgi:hypothetical protein